MLLQNPPSPVRPRLAATPPDQVRGRLFPFSLPAALQNLAIGLSPTKQGAMPGVYVEVTGAAPLHRAVARERTAGSGFILRRHQHGEEEE